uniref:ATP-binding cassette sub-family F member 3 n=1 Tax=Branchiostoma floridae TaxID=7739 RepID=C3XYM6_BRAFL|eukprot:XP_002610901.1 hypothetical protein BRAFLDRAFT_126285 [Branchiostoma floridae]
MAACSDILTKYFPSIDSELTDYIVGVLDSSAEDIHSTEDVYDAVGDMLLELSEEGTGEDNIRDICLEMIKALNINNDSKVTERQKLNAPVHLKSMAEDFTSQATNRREAKLDASGMNRSYDIHVENLDVAFGDKVLLQDADLHLAVGRRYGLVGRNGIGKTTLLKMLSSGELRIPSHLSVLHVEQEVVGDDTIAIDSVLESDLVRSSLLQEERELTATLNSTSPSTLDGRGSARLGEIYAKLEEIEADKAPARAAQILNGLGFTPKMQEMTTKEFSGGWRMRLALARALFMKPDLLLLDEPTNMLDIKAILWLENYLQTWMKTILVVSHDRLFLDSVATDIIHFHTRRLDYYRGNFEMFLKTKTEKLKNQQKEYESQKQYRDHIQVFIDRFRYNANRASQVQSKLKLLEKLPKLTPIEKEPDVILKFPDDIEKLSPPILRLDEIDFYYSPDRPIFKKVDISADLDSRIAIVGENGTGKTTLLKILIGELDPVNGIRHVHRNLRIGYFSQHHVDQLEMNVTSVELLASRFPGRKVEEYRHQLGSYGVSGELAMRPVASLSGGQKSRVAFANMAMVRPNFFILDEPTNHLDMETIEALGKALKKFKGGVILVSHDERLIRIVCKELWHLTLPINERGTKFDEEVDVDHDGKTLRFHVPDHNTVSDSKVVFDFKNRKVMTLFEKSQGKHCLLSDMPEDMASFESVEEGLKLVADPSVPTKIVRKTSVETNKRVLLDQVYDRSSLSPEMQEMCAGHEIHSVEEIGDEPEVKEGEPDGRGSARLGEIYAKLEEIEADKAPARAAQILNGLGFTPKMQEMTTKEFSGGWRMRLALARALFMKPDLLLLDEPTNMLDIKAILWLENYLQTWTKTILVVSHDRLFLDSVATDIIHFHTRRLDYYRGNFEMFLKTKTEKLKNQQKEYESQKQYRDHIQVFIDRFRYNANRASQVQSKLKLLEKLPKLTPIEKEPDVILKFPDDIEKLSPPILRLDEIDFYYSPDRPIFKKVDISADLDSRIAIVGENGTGKTTLLKILIGELDPVNGIRHVHRNLRIGYFSQHHVDQLEMNVTSVELLASRFPGRKVEEYRHQLGSYGVSGELAMRPVASLSGGQKSRVAFANMAMVRPNFFILDEPTNHLDMETIEALGKALKKFKGGVILVSHDERLIRIVCKELWVCGNGTVRSVEGGFDEYKKILEEEFLQQ